jgi:hypothetical protein
MAWGRVAHTAGVWSAWGLWVALCLPAHAAESRAREALDGQRASAEARMVSQWALAVGKVRGRPFAVVDKKDARIFVFGADGRLAGTAPVLLGSARGDDSAPGVARRTMSGIAIQERTTPAGRFESEPGHNDKGEPIVWVDYDAAVAIHRLRPAPVFERRPERLASDTADDNRISLGCIVVGTAFFDQVIAPTLGRRRGVVYVLPETRSTEAEFGIEPAELL